MTSDDSYPSDYQPETGLVAQRLEKVQSLRSRGVNPYANDVRVTHRVAEIFKEHGTRTQQELADVPVQVSVAGRLRFFRRMGKASFLKIQDGTVRTGIKPAGLNAEGEEVAATDDFLQLLVQANLVGSEGYELCQSLDLGDHVAASGVLMRTRTGELTVQAHDIKLLTKCIRPLPEKWHGLSDVEQRFRQRYVDFIMNQRAREIMFIRCEAVRLARQFFHERGYIEVETPLLHGTPGGAAARPFSTHHNTLDLDLFLRIAPELYLKRLLVGGFDRVFEIGRCFRNEGLDRYHNPEFTMLEFYQAYATFTDLMNLTEDLITRVVGEIHGGLSVTYDSRTIDFSPPWPRLTMRQAVSRHAGVEEEELGDVAALKELAARHQVPDSAKLSPGKLINALFEIAAEPNLVQPTFVTLYPIDVSPLSRKNEEDESLVDRFELFVGGREVANAFSELNDPVDQYLRFTEQLKARRAGDEEAHPMDRDYVRALEIGMPPAAGEGIGIDRLAMILANAPSIREVIPFPLLRPETGPTTTGE